ncbi:MAG TPA: tetratricopeptide repeat protein, partial [Bacteroidia bacterium]|nr:tetratricopeptide repeat protein [Bacteroidia bacterium]
EYTDVYFLRGGAYFKKGDFAKSTQDYTDDIKLNPKNGTTYYDRGLAYLKLGNNSWACDDFKMAKKLGSEEARKMVMDYCR